MCARMLGANVGAESPDDAASHFSAWKSAAAASARNNSAIFASGSHWASSRYSQEDCFSSCQLSRGSLLMGLRARA